MPRSLVAALILASLAVVAPPAGAATLEMKVVDAETGAPLGGHFYLTDGKTGKRIGTYTGTGLWHGQRTRYASFDPKGFSLELPSGPSRLWVERGREYLPVVESFTGEESGTVTRTIRLRRFIDMNECGWWSSDLHIHRGPTVTAQQIQREDVNVAFPLTWWNGPKFADDLKAWTAKAEDGRTVWLDKTHVMSLYNMEFEENPHGAIFLLNLPAFLEGSVPPVEKVCLAAGAAGALVNAAKPLWKCSVEAVILGQARMMEVVNNHYLWPAGMNNEAWGFPRNFAPDFRTYHKDFIGYAKYNCDIYYALLNCGYRLSAVGGTADGVLGTHVGYNRTYVYTGEKTLDLDNWLGAVRGGHTFATNGPMLFATVDGKLPGHEIRLAKGGTHEARVKIDVHSPDPLDAVEVIHNGAVAKRVAAPHAATTQTPPFRFETEVTVPITESGWIAVRAFSRVTPDNVALAHTTPVWFEVGDEPVRPRRAEVDALLKRANWWIDWAKEEKPGAVETYQRLKRILLTHRGRAR